MKYLDAKKTVIILTLNTLVCLGIWALPSAFESMLFQKIVVIGFTIAGVLLAGLFFVVNGFTWTLIDGAYEKEYYSHLKGGNALDEGQNLRPNVFKLSLCKRIYYARVILLFLLPIVLMYLFECVVILLEELL